MSFEEQGFFDKVYHRIQSEIKRMTDLMDNVSSRESNDLPEARNGISANSSHQS